MRFLISFFTLLVVSTGSTQDQQLEVDFLGDKPYFVYTISGSNTVYQWSKLLNMPVHQILTLNNISDANDIDAGKTLKVPFDINTLFRGESIKGRKNTIMTPVVYKVKPKEGLYRVAKVYCQEDIATMKLRNSLITNDLSIGQELIIGWMPQDSKTPVEYTKQEQIKEMPALDHQEKHEITSSHKVRLQEEMIVTLDTAATVEEVNYVTQKGIAIWKKSSKGHSMYVLHPTAKINSEILLYNPTVKRSVKAKVIGRIPAGTYQDDVSIIISPATAVNLGALDSRFQVEMKYVM